MPVKRVRNGGERRPGRRRGDGRLAACLPAWAGAGLLTGGAGDAMAPATAARSAPADAPSVIAAAVERREAAPSFMDKDVRR